MALDDARDGRTNVRAWVRWYADTGEAIYAAAYATHALGSQVYMNIAFPLPLGNLTSILDANQHQTQFQFDALNRQSKKIWPDQSFEQWVRQAVRSGRGWVPEIQGKSKQE